mmetsp:Transcript_37769/g.78409  ORF Transcript_37769/g.78409 Transcript_37769/m.78409 type:complete len:202 (-) Transcript_37769:434-1039(-)
MLDTQGSDNSLQTTRSSEGMARDTLGGGHHHLLFRRVITKYRFDGHRLELVIVGCGCSVGVYVGNLFLFHARHGHGHFHGGSQPSSFRSGCCDVMGVTCGTVSDQFGVDWDPTFLGRRQTFNNHDTGTFSHNESATTGIERTRTSLWIVVEIGVHGLHGTKASKAQGSDGGFGTSRHHDIGMAIFDHSHGFSNGMTSTGTC